MDVTKMKIKYSFLYDDIFTIFTDCDMATCCRSTDLTALMIRLIGKAVTQAQFMVSSCQTFGDTQDV